MCDGLVEAGCAVDGGKDSLSMAASDGAGGVCKSPGALTLTAYFKTAPKFPLGQTRSLPPRTSPRDPASAGNAGTRRART